MKTIKSKKVRIRVFDNGGKTYDRYTLIDTKTGDIFGSSTNPFAPNGFGQHCGNWVDSYMKITFGVRYSKPKQSQINSIVNEQISMALSENTWIGEEIIDLTTLSQEVQQYMKLIVKVKKGNEIDSFM